MSVFGWEYAGDPNNKDVLLRRATEIARRIFSKGFDTTKQTSDTRPIHKGLFSGLTPPLHPHFAGNYRGCDFPELKHYEVMIQRDSRVGVAPHLVLGEIGKLRDVIVNGLAVLDQHASSLAKHEMLVYTIQFACSVFQIFLRVHPYANGNGHIARWILWAILGRYGFRLRSFPIEPRPPDPPYTDCISAHRDGNRGPLEKFVLDAIDPGP